MNDQTAWMDQGRCVTETQPRQWDRIPHRRRQRICAACPVLIECRAFMGTDHPIPTKAS